MAVAIPNTIHASTIVLGNLGVLIRGDSGAGKSRLAHELIDKFNQDHQFAIWVSDDRTILQSKSGKIVAQCPDKIAGMAERRFAGIAHVDHQANCIVDLLVDLVDPQDLERLPEERFTDWFEESAPISTIRVPNWDIPQAIELIFDHVTKLLAQNR